MDQSITLLNYSEYFLLIFTVSFFIKNLNI